MGSVWQVPAADDRKDLSWQAPDGQTYQLWIRVKKRLNVGDERRIMTAGWRGVSGRASEDGRSNTEINIDWKLQNFARLDVWITDWSLADDAGNKLPKTVETFETLDPKLFTLLDNAVSEHIAAVAEKKSQTPDGAAGQ